MKQKEAQKYSNKYGDERYLWPEDLGAFFARHEGFPISSILVTSQVEMALAMKRAFYIQQRTQRDMQIGDEKYETYDKIDKLGKAGEYKKADKLLNERNDTYDQQMEAIAGEILDVFSASARGGGASPSSQLDNVLKDGYLESLLLDYDDIKYCANELFKLGTR